MEALPDTLPEVKSLADDALIDEMREQVSWARNSLVGYDPARFKLIMAELRVRDLVTR